jgi:hypothetical protein
MCNPSIIGSIGKASTYAQIGGAALSTIGTFSNAVASKRAASANADAEHAAAVDAQKRGMISEGNTRLRTAQLKSQQKVGFASGNIALDSGSPLDVLNSTDVMGEQDALTVRENANRESTGHMTSASNYEAQAGATNPFALATGTMLTQGGMVADRWYQLNRDKSLYDAPGRK